MATTTITKINYRHLLNIAKLINKYAIKELQFISIIPSGEGKRNFFEISPSLKEFAGATDELVDYCNEKGISVKFAGVPMCILGKNYICSYDLWEEFKVDNTDIHNNKLTLWKEPGAEAEEFKIDIGRIKTNKCEICAKESICGGIYQKYCQRYGDKELTPFKS
jgi:MoaA/NifB/PqqE/SkfB family radical SAM enzyme